MEQSIRYVNWFGVEDEQKVGKRWGWVLALGIALVVLGVFAASYIVFSTAVSVYALGYLLIAGGILQIAGSFSVKEWSGFFGELLLGIFGVVAGIMIVNHPIAAGVGLTLIIAAYLMVEGIFRTVAAIAYRYHGWGFSLFSGAITFALGLMVYAEWPLSSLWLLGAFLAVRLLFSGMSAISLSMILKALRGPKEAQTIKPGPRAVGQY